MGLDKERDISMELYFHPDTPLEVYKDGKPVSLLTLANQKMPNIIYDSGILSFSDSVGISSKFKEFLEANWKKREEISNQRNTPCFSLPLGALVTAKPSESGNFVARFCPTEFKQYIGIAYPHIRLPSDLLEEHKRLYGLMRIGFVGCAVYLQSDKGRVALISTRPSDTYFQAPNDLDSTVAGYMPPVLGFLNPFEAIREKFKRELKLSESDLEKYLQKLSVTGIFSGRDHSSGGVAFVADLNISLEQLRDGKNPDYLKEIEAIQEKRLPEVLIRRFLDGKGDGEGRLITDGFGILSLSLGCETFKEIAKNINKETKKPLIMEGTLENFVFKPTNEFS